MAIQVKFFASLRETFGGGDEIEASRARSIRDVWQIATHQADYPANTLCAINMHYAKFNDVVQDGDEVAFFPPVTGG